MRTITIYVSDDGMRFADEKDCREHERKVAAEFNAALLDEYWFTHNEIHHMKETYYPNVLTLPMLQAELLHAKNAYLFAKKHGVKASKANRFAELAKLQYKYYCSKEELAHGIALYRKRKAKLRELGERLGFKGARPAAKEVAK